MHERLFHGVGAGDDLDVVELPGRPRGRADLLGEPHAAGPLGGVRGRAADLGGANRRRQRRLAGHRPPHRHRVGRVRGLGPPVHPRVGLPGRLPVPLPEGSEQFGRGGAAIIEPTWGNVLAGPLYDEEGMVVADCDLREGLRAKRWFDAVGHYSRRDVLA